jgi:predicted phosphodiesterase
LILPYTPEEIAGELLACGGNITECARRLKLDRATVRKYGTSPIPSVGLSEPVVRFPSIARTASSPPRHHSIERIAFLSDIHFPFQDKVALAKVLAFLGNWKPDEIILGGDIFDCYSISDYNKEPGRHETLQDEFDSARDFIAEVDEIAKGKVRFFIGNHENRIYRHVAQYPALYKLRSLDFGVAAGLPAHFQVHGSQYHHRVGGLLLLHGDLQGRVSSGGINPAATMLKKLRTSCMFGHWHRFGQFYETNYDGTVRGGFANGHLSDEKQAKYISSPDWQKGFTTIEHAQGLFAVKQHLVINGQLLTDGILY